MEGILIIDFGSQYTQLIARRVRELEVFCEIIPFHKEMTLSKDIKGIILSGGPSSVYEQNAPSWPLKDFVGKVPILGICYGAQLIAYQYGGKVTDTGSREYGRAALQLLKRSKLTEQLSHQSQVWMSHGDSITVLPEGFELIANTPSIPTAVFASKTQAVYGIQFHPEVSHSPEGQKLLASFLFDICGVKAEWTSDKFIEETVGQLRNELKGKKVICGLSGGVDSSVAAILIQRAIGEDLICIFVNNGLLRKGEYEEVLDSYKTLGLNIIGVDASERFLTALAGETDPETKRKVIGRVFVDVFQEEAAKMESITHLAQGTIYPDVIESISVNGPSATIKSHHNVGGLPETLHLEVVEPLKMLFKDEVRRVGRGLSLPDELLGRHPFPGPGLAIRIPGEVSKARVTLLQEADKVFIDALKAHHLYDEIWQAFTVLLPVSSVGVMGDQRTYENVLALRAVTSLDGMTADWARLPYEFLAEVSNQIINNIRGINRVVYDISSKPPATIEWE